jgi:translation initiation factor eIF-2B subunit epsilon
MIEYTLEFLASNGVEEVFVFCCAHAEQIVAYLESSAWSQTPGFVVHTIVSTNCISAGEAMRLIDHRHVIRADFVLVHGDVVANADLRRAIDAHKRRRAKDKLAMVTMCVKPLTQRLREERFGGQNLVFVTDPDTDRVLHYEEHAAPSPPAPGDERRASGRRLSRLPPLALDASLFSDHPRLRVRSDLGDCHVDICAPEVLLLFTDNFDYQHLRRDFLVGTLNERELGNAVYAHELGPEEYAARVENFRAYDAVSRDVVGRWTYPLCPDVNALPRGVRVEYRARGGFPPSYVERGAKVSTEAVVGEGCVVAADAEVEAGATLVHSVIGRGAIVRAGARLDGAYVMPGAVIGERVEIRRAMVCEGATVHADAVVGAGAILSRDVVVAEGHRVADGARVSLAHQPDGCDDDYDSDEDGLEVGSFTPKPPGGGFLASERRRSSLDGDGRRLSDSGNDASPDESSADSARLDAERSALAAAKRGGEDVVAAYGRFWAPEGVGANGAGHVWHPRGPASGEEERRFGLAPADARLCARGYAADDALDSDDEREEARGRGGALTRGSSRGNDLDGATSDSDAEAEDEEAANGAEGAFRREVAETFLRCVKHGYAQANAVVELQGLKMAENRTFADIARYVLMTVLGLALPAPADVTKENARLYPAEAPAGVAALVKNVRERAKQWAPLLSRFLKSEDDQVEMLLTLEEYCAEEAVFKGMGGAALVPAFAKILHMLYELDVLSEASVLAWAEEKELAAEEDKRFLALAAPFVEWLRDAESEEESEEETEESEEEEDE